jgi:hypothetical protein
MPIVVEDGTGLATAESYLSVAGADTHHAGRSTAAEWAALTTGQKEAALRGATDWLVMVYRMAWKGTRVNAVQALDWPRNDVERADYAYGRGNGLTTISGDYYYPSDEVPAEVEWATAYMALKAHGGELLPEEAQRAKREKVGPIEVEYADWGSQSTRYPAVDGKLAPLLKNTGNSMKVVRS